MDLRDLMGREAPEVEISALAYASDSVTPGALFFCVPGFVVDGHEFAPDAVKRGAAAVVCERPLGLEQVEDRVGRLGEACEPPFSEASERAQGIAAHDLSIGLLDESLSAKVATGRPRRLITCRNS